MSDKQFQVQIAERFQGLFEDELIAEIQAMAKHDHFPPESIVIDIDENIEFLPLILKGSMKIMTEDEEGRELLLYYLESGDTCAVTLNCCSGKTRSRIRAITETETDLVFIPIQLIEVWMGKYSSWRNFILETYDYRLNEMLMAIDSLAFQNMQERLYKYLRDKALVTGSKSINYTQSEIANDLHSSRVVISRLLKKLEEDGLISHKRNEIVISKL